MKQPCFKEYLKYVSLNVLGMLGLSFYILADTFFISRGLGASGLTALNLAIPVYSFIHGIGLMLGMGGATKYSIYKSLQENRRADSVFTNIVRLTGALAALTVLTGIFLSSDITAVLGADQEVFEMTNTYLKVICLFSPAFLMNDIFICFIRNDGNPQLSMIGMLGGSLSNVALDYFFIFILKMGIFGAVLATGLAPVISLSILSVHFIRKRNGFHFRRAEQNLKILPEALPLGFPSLVAEVSSGIVIVVFNMIILSLKGNVGVAAYGVVANLSLVVVSVYTGIAQGIQPLFSKAHGRGDTWTIRQVLGYALATLLVLSGAIYCAVYYFAAPITNIFNSENNSHLQIIAETGLKLYFIAAPFVGFNIIAAVLFTSTEKAVPAHVISLLRGLIVIVPMAYLLSAVWGISGVWLAFPMTELLVAALGAGILIQVRTSWNTKSVLDTELSGNKEDLLK